MASQSLLLLNKRQLINKLACWKHLITNRFGSNWMEGVWLVVVSFLLVDSRDFCPPPPPPGWLVSSHMQLIWLTSKRMGLVWMPSGDKRIGCSWVVSCARHHMRVASLCLNPYLGPLALSFCPVSRDSAWRHGSHLFHLLVCTRRHVLRTVSRAALLIGMVNRLSSIPSPEDMIETPLQFTLVF